MRSHCFRKVRECALKGSALESGPARDSHYVCVSLELRFGE
jgi:hypothetical protein